MVCLGLEHGAAGWKAQTNPLSYGGTWATFLLQHLVTQFMMDNDQICSTIGKIEVTFARLMCFSLGQDALKLHKVDFSFKIAQFLHLSAWSDTRQNFIEFLNLGEFQIFSKISFITSTTGCFDPKALSIKLYKLFYLDVTACPQIIIWMCFTNFCFNKHC